MKIVLVLVAILAGVLVLVWGAGVLIPRHHVAARSARFSKPAETVWQVVSDLPGFSKWAPEVTGVSRLPDQNGHPVWALEGKWAMPLEIEESVPPRRMVTRIAEPKMPFGGAWTWEIVPAGDGCVVTLTERGEIKAPVFRTLTRFVFGYTATIDSYLKALGRHLREDITPEPAVAGV